MRFMVIIKSDGKSESSALPDEKLLTAMGNYNEALHKAGVMVAMEGLLPTAKGARVSIKGGKLSVSDGPFSEAKELVGGFWIWQVKSKAEAIEWLKKSPFVDCELEIRQIAEEADFGNEFSPEARAQEARIREGLSAGKKAHA